MNQEKKAVNLLPLNPPAPRFSARIHTSSCISTWPTTMTQDTGPKLKRKDLYYFDLVVFQVRSYVVHDALRVLIVGCRRKIRYLGYRRITFRLQACLPQFSLYHLERRMSKAQKINLLCFTESAKLTLRVFWNLCILRPCRSLHFQRQNSSWYRTHAIFKHGWQVK